MIPSGPSEFIPLSSWSPGLQWYRFGKTTILATEARFRRYSTHVRNLTDESSTAKEQRLNQFGTAVLVWYGQSVKFDRVCRTFVELILGSTHGTPSESHVAPVSLQSRTYSVRFGTWKVRRLNQILVFSHRFINRWKKTRSVIHSTDQKLG